MFYAFLSDDALINRQRVRRANGSDTAVGFFDDGMQNYFVSPGEIDDPRTSRQTIDGRVPMLGCVLNFDDNQAPPDFDNIPDGEISQLFNIAEYLAYKQSVTAADLHASLIADEAAFGIYVTDGGVSTVSVGTETVVSTVTDAVGVVTSGINIRPWVQFSVRFTVSGVPSDIFVCRIWLGRASFLAAYPISTIVAAILPIGPEYLIDPSLLTSALDAVEQATGYAADAVGEEVAANDHSGIYELTTGYYTGSPTPTQACLMTFKVLYRGAAPTAAAARGAARGALEAITEVGGSPVDVTVWQSLFPDLYADASFFLFPLYANTYNYNSQGSFPRGISLFGDYIALVTANFVTEGESALTSRMDLVHANSTELLVIAVSAVDNDPAYTHLKTIHPSYQASPVSVAVIDPITELFRQNLNTAISIATGAIPVQSGFTETSVDLGSGDLAFVSFALNGITYYVRVND